MTRRDGTDIPADAWEFMHPQMQGSKPWVVVRPSIPGPKTVLVLGAFRGGTSFAAERLATIGVCLGRDYGPVTPEPNYVSYEDPHLGKLIDEINENAHIGASNADNWQHFRTLVSQHNSSNPDVWGFKKPSSVFVLDAILPILRNPHAILILRDPIASWQSSIRHGRDLGWHNCRHHHCVLLDHIEKPRCPLLVLSFELALKQVKEVESAMQQFVFGERDA